MEVEDPQQSEQCAISAEAEDIVEVLVGLRGIIYMSLLLRSEHIEIVAFYQLVVCNKLFGIKDFKFDDVDMFCFGFERPAES